MAIQWVAAAAFLNQNDMDKANIKSMKWAMLLGTATLLCLASCDDDCLQVDTQSPRLTVTSPQEGQAYKNGDTIRIEASVTDNELLHEYIWGIRDDTSGVVVPDTIAYAHEKMEHSFSGVYVVSGVTTTALWKVTVHADDEKHNSDEKQVNIVVGQ